jgi:hypothetical protein
MLEGVEEVAAAVYRAGERRGRGQGHGVARPGREVTPGHDGGASTGGRKGPGWAPPLRERERGSGGD